MIWTFISFCELLPWNNEIAEVDEYMVHYGMSCPGDAVEANAIKSLFSNHATSGALALSSTKVILGKVKQIF